MRDAGRFHKLKWGGGQLTIPKDMVNALHLDNKDKVLIEFDEVEKILRITKM